VQTIKMKFLRPPRDIKVSNGIGNTSRGVTLVRDGLERLPTCPEQRKMLKKTPDGKSGGDAIFHFPLSQRRPRIL
jgi:hypothetical protein